jgi:hypothetical protein
MIFCPYEVEYQYEVFDTVYQNQYLNLIGMINHPFHLYFHQNFMLPIKFLSPLDYKVLFFISLIMVFIVILIIIIYFKALFTLFHLH